MGLHDKTHSKEGRSLDAVKVPTAIDVAYAAGFFDGDGTCYAKNGRHAYVRVFQKDPEMLYRFRDFFGGTVLPHKGHKHLGINGGPIFVWGVGGSRAKDFLRRVYPLVSSYRKSQIDATEFRKDKPEPRQVPLVKTVMTDERMIARSVMTPLEKHRESCKWFRENNRERTRHQGTNLWRRKHSKKSPIPSEMEINRG